MPPPWRAPVSEAVKKKKKKRTRVEAAAAARRLVAAKNAGNQLEGNHRALYLPDSDRRGEGQAGRRGSGRPRPCPVARPRGRVHHTHPIMHARTPCVCVYCGGEL